MCIVNFERLRYPAVARQVRMARTRHCRRKVMGEAGRSCILRADNHQSVEGRSIHRRPAQAAAQLVQAAFKIAQI